MIIRDYSHWNIINDYNLAVASSDANIIKNYDAEIPGGNGEDPAHDDHWAGLSSKPLGEYLFLDPHGSPRNQVLGYMRHSYRGFMDVLDAEDKEGMPYQQITNVTIDALGEGQIEAGRKWWLYANLDWLNNVLLEPQKIIDLVDGIWLAYPTGYPYPAIVDRVRHYPPELIKMLQYDWWADVPGVQGDVDESIWLGTDAEWNQLVNPTQPNTVEVSVPADADIIVIKRGNL